MKRLGSLAGMSAALLLIVISAVTFFSLMRFTAELAAQDARFQFGRWEAGKAEPRPEEAVAAVSSLRAALKSDPGNPSLHSDIGRLEYWRVRKGSLVDPASRAAREAALASFRQAALLRPTSGFAWTNIALTRHLLGRVDSEFAQALEQTMRWAPWHPQLQLLAIELGLATWQILDEPRQHRMAEAIRRQAQWTMVDQKPALIKLLRAYGRKELGCPWAGKALACPDA